MKYNQTLIILVLLIAVLQLTSCSREKVSTDIDDYTVDSPAEQLLKQVKKSDFVVHEDGDVVSGQEIWAEFYEAVMAGEPAVVKIADYYDIDRDRVSPEFYEENKDDYPVIYLAELSYDGKEYTYRSINGLDGVNGYTRVYSYLMRYEDIPGEQATFTFCERYVLVNDNTVTYERLQYGLYSAQIGDYINFTNVYNDYTYKPEYQ